MPGKLSFKYQVALLGFEPRASRLRQKRYCLRTSAGLLTNVGSHCEDQLLLYVPLSLMFRKSYVLPTHCIYVFSVDLRTDSNHFPIRHELTGFYSRDGVCLLRGTDWIFIYNSA